MRIRSQGISRIYPTLPVICSHIECPVPSYVTSAPARTIHLNIPAKHAFEFLARMFIDVLHDNQTSEPGRNSTPIELLPQYAMPRVGFRNFIRDMLEVMPKSGKNMDIEKATDQVIKHVQRVLDTHKETGFPRVRTYEAHAFTTALDPATHAKFTHVRDSKGQLHLITTNTLAMSTAPIEVMFDQAMGNMLPLQIGRLCTPHHISIPNFMDMGNGFRNQNHILSALLRKINQPCIIPRVLPRHLKSYISRARRCRPKNSRLFNLFIKEYIVDEHFFSQSISQHVATNPNKVFKKMLHSRYDSYVKNFQRRLFQHDTYLVHCEPRISMQITLELPNISMVCLDVTYSLDVNTGICSYKLFDEINTHLHSAEDVRKATFGLSHDDSEFKWKLYNALMKKFIGDVGQILYSLHMGIMFASGDTSALSLALFIMKVLDSNDKLYAAFKSHDNVLIGRGMSIMAQHRDTHPFYFLDHNAKKMCMDSDYMVREYQQWANDSGAVLLHANTFD